MRRIRSILTDIRRTPANSMPHMDYNAYWQERGRSGMRPRYALFASLIDEGASVLDIGCGDGGALYYLAKQREVKGTGLDISETAVSLACERGIDAQVADASAPDFALGDTYDYIIISEVLEHIAEPECVLEAVRGHFDKALLLSVPNIGYWRHRLRLLFGRFPVQWQFHPAEHLRFWTVLDFTAWLEGMGYRATRVIASDGFLPLSRRLPNLFGNQIVYEVRQIK